MPRAIELMKKREEEILKTLTFLSEKTSDFSSPKVVMVGGYALRAFIRFSRFTRDCDFILRKRDGWHLDAMSEILPQGYSVEAFEKKGSYGFLRCFKPVEHGKRRIRVSLDFMEGEMRGRAEEETILIDERTLDDSRFASIEVAGEEVRVLVPSYLDYFIMKVVSARASDIRDIASLVLENGAPSGVKKRVSEILAHPTVFVLKLRQRVVPEIRKRTFVDSWRGMFATREYGEEDKKRVLAQVLGLAD